jgi:RNA polymerase sigma-70 factor (ECF subfamily)
VRPARGKVSDAVAIIVPMPGHADADDASDEAMMLRYAAGEVAAFDVLYMRHARGAWRYLLRHVRDPAVADELLQEVWFTVARQAPRYQVSARFRTWLFTLAHNRMVDHLRTRRQHQSLDTPVAGDDDADAPMVGATLAADSGFGPLRRLQGREQADALLAAIADLPVEQRDAFLLQAEAGMSVQEIAAATGVAFETAKSRLRYARQSLRRRLQEFA